MAGLGRRTHYRKHLTDSIIYDFPEPGENERIAKVVATRGGNQFDIILPTTTTTTTTAADIDKSSSSGKEDHLHQVPKQQPPEGQLAILPTKFNKLVWVKRNDFVIVETAVDKEDAVNSTKGPPPEAAASENTGGIRYIISHILYKDQVKHLQSKGLWPTHDKEFVPSGREDPDDHHHGNTTTTSTTTTDDRGEKNVETADDGIVYDVEYEDDDVYLVNTNRLATLKVDDSSDSEDSD